jgi:hypothetical protein
MSRGGNCLYNLDRAVASLFGAPPQETISSEVGRVARGTAHGHNRVEQWAALLIARWLDTDKHLWGQDHTLKAILHADQLDKADDGAEQ